MSGVIIGLRVVTNQVTAIPPPNSDAQYSPAMLELVKNLYRPYSPDIIFLAYYKVAVSHQDFGLPRGNNNKPKKGLLNCSWKGIFVAAGKDEIRQFTVSHNSRAGYSPKASLNKLLVDYAVKVGEVNFAVSAFMKKSSL